MPFHSAFHADTIICTAVKTLNNYQKDFSFQAKLYQTAQEIVFSCKSVAVVALRESSFRKLIRTPQANAFSSIDFHVKAPPLTVVLEKRLHYLAAQLNELKPIFHLADGKDFGVQDFDRFLALIHRSILGDGNSDEIIECLLSITNGNVREQLKLIYAFLVSGQTKIDEYFWHYAASTKRVIPFHEFLHSIIHEDRKVFEEQPEYDFMNVFEPDVGSIGSHFTALRILEYFRVGLGQSGDLRSSDFIRLGILADQFASQGLNAAEIEQQCFRLAKFGLIMPESQEVNDLFSNEAVALTVAGRYYVTKLFCHFNYFGSVASDTSMDDDLTANAIGQVLVKNRHYEKLPLPARIDIGRRFVNYLEAKEHRELNEGAVRKHKLFGSIRFVPAMRQGLERAQPN